jgi:hypothetical protein
MSPFFPFFLSSTLSSTLTYAANAAANPLAATAVYQRDAFGQLTDLAWYRGPEGPTTERSELFSYAYDNRGRLTRERRTAIALMGDAGQEAAYNYDDHDLRYDAAAQLRRAGSATSAQT